MNQLAILYADRFTKVSASYDDRLSHRVGRFVARADRRRGKVSERLTPRNSDTPTPTRAQFTRARRLPCKRGLEGPLAQAKPVESKHDAASERWIRKTDPHCLDFVPKPFRSGDPPRRSCRLKDSPNASGESHRLPWDRHSAGGSLAIWSGPRG